MTGRPQATSTARTDPAAERRPGGVQSLDRAFDLLELMAATEGGVGLSQLAATSGLPVPTIHRIVRTLVSSGYVLQLPSRRYALGPRLIGLGARATTTLDAWARPHLAALAERTEETANMAMLDGDMVVYVAQVPPLRHTMRMFTEVGRRVFAHCTGVGKALLAQLPEDTARDLVLTAGMPAQTDRTITDLDVFAGELRRIRQQGYAVDDGEQERGVRCVAVPIPGSPTIAVSVSGPAGRLTPESLPQLVPVLMSAADDLARRPDRHTASGSRD
ncbi:MAG: IclR family transcriptional regulator, acetate operon repressor [Actinomycetota bacterium]|jgi:IclR family acetate operon transcriptional repressor|nr:IclR family transcriptional regulator, acetate operon repressor [Actinomycetota bacterium]